MSADRGRIHALLGENGAGKSTLIKILAGVVQPGRRPHRSSMASQCQFASPYAANAAGIACIFQELSLLPDLTVADNIAITNPPMRFGLIDQARAAADRRRGCWPGSAARTFIRLAPVGDLPLSRRQMVEIAKALARNPKILILDEATSALTAADVTKVFAHAEAAARPKAWRSSIFPTACTRSPSLPTIARCSATAATSRRSLPAPRPTTPSSS